MKEKSTENVVQGYLLSIFAHKGGCIEILVDNDIELKNAVITDASELLCMKRLYSNCFHPPWHSRIEDAHNHAHKLPRLQ